MLNSYLSFKLPLFTNHKPFISKLIFHLILKLIFPYKINHLKFFIFNVKSKLALFFILQKVKQFCFIVNSLFIIHKIIPFFQNLNFISQFTYFNLLNNLIL